MNSSLCLEIPGISTDNDSHIPSAEHTLDVEKLTLQAVCSCSFISLIFLNSKWGNNTPFSSSENDTSEITNWGPPPVADTLRSTPGTLTPSPVKWTAVLSLTGVA